MRGSELLQQKTREVLEQITSRVSTLVDAYREQYFAICEKEVHFSAGQSDGFSLERRRYPAAALDCRLDSSGTIIAARYAQTQDSASPLVERRVDVQLVLDASGTVTFEMPQRKFATVDDLARFLVEDILQ